jgi:hypothetical protein
VKRAASLVALTVLLAGCSPPARSTSFFEAHPAEVDSVLAACTAGSQRGAECDNANLAKAHRAADDRMSQFKKSF